MNKKLKLDFTKYYRNDFYVNQGNSIKEALKFNSKKRRLPLEVIESVSSRNTMKEVNGDHIIYWFRNDLRIQDNTGLFNSIKEAKKINKNVVGLYVISTKFWKAHLDSAWKIKLIETILTSLASDLERYQIPLSIVYLNDAEEHIDFTDWFRNLINQRFNSNTVYFNLIYDYDELNRDIGVLKSDLNIRYFHDSCAVKPLTLKTKSTNTQFSKFSPWFKKWLEKLQLDPIEVKVLDPESDTFAPWNFKEFQRVDSYSLPMDLRLSSLASFGVTSDDIHSFTLSISNVSESSVLKHLSNWLVEDAKNYLTLKDFPARSRATSKLSSFLSVGLISARKVCEESEKVKSNSKDGNFKKSVDAFIREVAFRDFYKHILSNWPYLEFNVPFNFSSLNLKLDEDPSKFESWALGKTGVPIVDAAMRQLLRTGYMNNRCRMITASFLTKDLNQDWRWGQAWFYHHLIDGDFSSNNGGWQWCASVGVDAQPWFRIFNVYTQSEKFDPNGDFIREWVDELKDVKDKKKIHTGENVKGYMSPIVDRVQEREKVLERYREALS
jgi:deoxyribodipyrimidine photo-lyase